jgi:drug/metabolite transporter (DMT)-like permease
MTNEFNVPAKPTSARFVLPVMLFVVYSIWGSAHLVNQVMVRQMPPLYMASLRYLTAGTLLYLFARLSGTPRPTWQHWKASAQVGLLLLTIANGALVIALRHLPTSMTALLGGSLPLFILLLNWFGFARERPNQLAITGLIIGVAGLYLLVVPTWATEVDYKLPFFLSIFLLVISNLSWAYGVLLAARLPLPSQLLACSMQMLVGGSSLLVCSLVVEQTTLVTLLIAPPESLWAMLYLILIGSIVGYTLYVWLARNASPRLIASFGFMGPVVGVGLGVIVAHEALNLLTIVGGLLALAGSYLLQRGKQPSDVQPPIPATRARRRVTARV